MNNVSKINLKENVNLKDAVLKVVDEIGGFKKFVKTGAPEGSCPTPPDQLIKNEERK